MFPLVFKLTGKRLLFVGGGKVAKRKISSIITQSKPDITIISKELHPKLKELLTNKGFKWIQSAFDEGLIKEKYDFAFVCTNDRAINEKAAKSLKSLSIPVNVCDNKELSDFFMPAVLSYKDVLISVTTKGESPAIAKKVKEILLSNLEGEE